MRRALFWLLLVGSLRAAADEIPRCGSPAAEHATLCSFDEPPPPPPEPEVKEPRIVVSPREKIERDIDGGIRMATIGGMLALVGTGAILSFAPDWGPFSAYVTDGVALGMRVVGGIVLGMGALFSGIGALNLSLGDRRLRLLPSLGGKSVGLSAELRF